MLNSLMKVLALKNLHTSRKEIDISSKLWLCRDWLQHILKIQLFLLFTIEFPKEEARWKPSLLAPIRFSYSSKISSNCVNVALPYICYWLRQFHLQPQNSVLSWLRQFYLQPQSSALSNLRLVSYFALWFSLSILHQTDLSNRKGARTEETVLTPKIKNFGSIISVVGKTTIGIMEPILL